MMKRTYRGVVVLIILTSQNLPPVLSVDNFTWNLADALAKGELQNADRILSENAARMTAAEKRLAYSFVLDYTRGETTLEAIELLRKHNIHAAQFDLYNAINKSHIDPVIDRILDEGIQPNGEILLTAAEKQRWDFVRLFAEMDAGVNYKYPADKSYADGMTALIHAVNSNNPEMVRFLVEHGADVNLRTNAGGTAASIAYENGFVDIYNYLKDHGALDFVQILPQTETSSANGQSTGQGIGQGQGIARLIDNGTPLFTSGTYRLSGSAAEIKFTGAGSGAGYLSYKNTAGNTVTGIFQLTGSTLTLTTEGITFTYRVDSASSFSGNGETWIRFGD
ncbi:MAG: ankyrin repeat domain-containing protein [Treponema sp.]|nr:ankyrin repeat domain-containing protein [Treponema sp.]